MGLFAAASCGDAGPPVASGLCQPVDPAVGFSARDSGGVRVVENLSPAGGLSLQLVDEPTAVIGARDDDPDDVIGRLAGAVLLPDDGIVLADGLAMEHRRLLWRSNGLAP